MGKSKLNEYNYIDCRNKMSGGHRWDHYGPMPGERSPKTGHVFAHFRCERCGAIKRYEIHLSTGSTDGPRYFDYPKDYKLKVDQRELRRFLANQIKKESKR